MAKRLLDEFGVDVISHVVSIGGVQVRADSLSPKEIKKRAEASELRCADPTAFDLDYTRDLGAGAVRTLLGGTSGVMITRQGAEIVPIPFDELMDPKTHKTRVREVDVETESHGSARALQVRIEPGDLDDAKRLARIAEAAKLEPEQARERWAGAAIGLSG